MMIVDMSIYIHQNIKVWYIEKSMYFVSTMGGRLNKEEYSMIDC